MLVDERVLAAIDALYTAALDDARWPDALRTLATLTGSQAATFWVLNASNRPTLPLFTFIELDPTFVRDYLESAAHIDPTVQYLVTHPQQRIVHDGLVISEQEKDRHPYYDWHAQYSDLRFRLVGQACPAPGVQAGIALHRNRNAGRYEPADLDRFTFLHHHLEQALRVAFRLGALGAVQQCSAELLDRSPSAVILLDSSRRVVHVNARAEALRAHGDGILLVNNALALLHRADNRTLQAFITTMLAADRSAAAMRATVMRAERPSGKRAYGILITGLCGPYSVLSTVRPAVCVIVSDPERDGALAEDRLQSAFGLTAAESRLAARLAAGEDLKAAAERLGITYASARTRLAEIFRKTETGRQGELIHLLLTTVGTL
jgi:DNA-binding CsgD family transcriptional regulator